jgi:hypothetical protein
MRDYGTKKGVRLGGLAGMCLCLFGKARKKVPLMQNKFSTNTRKTGLLFAENIRQFWRKKWVLLRK